MHHDLTIKVQHSPNGARVTGPDPDRTFYVHDGHRKTVTLHANTEHVWSSPELDIFVLPLPDGAEIRIVHRPRVAQVTAKAA